MTWQYAVATLIFSILAYLIGSLSWAIIISKTFKKEDIRTKGSGNAGATNALRNYGLKVGLAVVVLDVAKPVVAVAIPFAVMHHSGSSLFASMSLQCIGFFTIVGHILPVFFKFKGGKGAASLAGYMLATQWFLFILGIIVLLIVLYTTKKVSLGSIITPGVLIVIHILLNGAKTSPFREQWATEFMWDSTWWISTCFMTAAWLLVIYRHKENIKRLRNKTERTLQLRWGFWRPAEK